MENFINSLPKPVLAVLVILVGIGVFMILNPPHSVCDTQAQSLKESQKGVIFPGQVKKSTIPPTISRAKEACQLGNSAGSCYEYFQILRGLADNITQSSAECAKPLFNITEVRGALNDGIELMVRLAWGLKPPEPTLDRFGWLQESELSTFCRLRSLYIRANGEEAWTELRRRVSKKLPGEEVPLASDPTVAMPEARPATALLPEQDIWNRSLFSVRCDAF